MSESNSVLKSVEDVKKTLGSEIVDFLTVFEKEGNICLKPKQYLGKDTFNDILGRVRELGGSYGNGLFKIPLKAEKAKELPSSYDEVHQMVMDLRNYVDKATEGILKKLVDLR